MKPLFNVMLLFMVVACNSPQTNNENPAATQPQSLAPMEAAARTVSPDTVTNLADMNDTLAYFKDADGMVYKVTLSGDDGQRSLVALSCDTDIFLGTDRYVAKTTRLTKTYETFTTINAFRATLQADSIMRNHSPAVTKDSASVRVTEEKRNITINKCYLYAIKRESDNDFHMIVGHDTTPAPSELLNIEVSGLPDTTSASYATLKMVRDTIENRFGEVCKSSYTLFSPPMKMLIKGSLFYDIDHAPGIVGPTGYRPNTSWEIHPVTKVSFK